MIRLTHTRGRRAPSVDDLDGPRVRIGAAAACDVVLEDANVVAEHAEIRVENGAATVTALGSDDVFVNGARVKTSPLKGGDRLVVGHSPGAEMIVDPNASRPTEKSPLAAPIVVPMPPRASNAAVEDARVDIDTARRLVQEAVVRATNPDGVVDTERIVAEKVATLRKRTKRANTLLTMGILLALVASVATGVFLWRAHEQAQVLAAEAGFEKTAKPVSGEIPQKVLTSREIFDENKGSLYLIGYLLGHQVGGICTAFAISSNELATNSHCVLGLRKEGGQPVVTQNDSGGKRRFKIVGMQAHPKYNPKSGTTDTPDVGLLRVEGTLPSHVTIANDAELRAIGPGDDICVLGFPGRVMDPLNPSATFLSGHVGRVMGWNQGAASPDTSYLVQHDAVTRGGNSGSPIFNQYGHVIAVHAAHIDEEAEETYDGQKTKVTQSSPFRIGMRIDLLKGVPQP